MATSTATVAEDSSLNSVGLGSTLSTPGGRPIHGIPYGAAHALRVGRRTGMDRQRSPMWHMGPGATLGPASETADAAA